MEFNDIKLLDENVDFSKIRPYNWDLVIGGVPYYVCRIEGYAHTISYRGGRETRQCLWCYPRDQKPSLDNVIEYTLKSPVDWGIEFHDGNYIRTKWDETEVLPCPKTIITRNGEHFYTVLGDRDYSIPKAMTLLNDIEEHPLEFDTIDYDLHMIGRKIWFSGQPGIITRYVRGQCCILVAPDGFDRWMRPAEFWAEEGVYYDEDELKIDCLNNKYSRVWWFRD